jgi:hypothetical protein
MPRRWVAGLLTALAAGSANAATPQWSNNLFGGDVIVATAGAPTLHVTHGTHINLNDCSYSGSLGVAPGAHAVAGRDVFQDSSTCMTVMLVGSPADVEPPFTSSTVIEFAGGPVLAVGSDSMTVGPIVCSAGILAPLLERFAVGDQALLSCRDGAIFDTAKSSAGLSSLTGARGAIRQIRSDAVSIGDITCRFGSASPALTGYHAGDVVAIMCRGGVLGSIEKAPSTGR